MRDPLECQHGNLGCPLCDHCTCSACTAIGTQASPAAGSRGPGERPDRVIAERAIRRYAENSR